MTLETTYPETVIHVDNHTSDVFSNAETRARASFYGVSGVPDVRIDGSRSSVGAGDGCNSRFNIFRGMYNARMTETNSVSPVQISQTLFSIGSSTAELTATFTLVDPVALGTVSAYFFLYEDDITWCCGYGGVSSWDHITRSIKSEAVTTLVNVGDHVTISKTVTLSPTWNVDNLHAVAILQQTTGTKPVYQAQRLARLVDFTLDMPDRIHSVVAGSGEALFTGHLTNEMGAQDTYTLNVDQAAGWPTDFQVEGDPAWYTTHVFNLSAGISKQITVRVRTDATLRAGTGNFTVQALSSGRAAPVALRVFNHSPSIMMVDDDGGHVDWNGEGYETYYESGMAVTGFICDDWDVMNGHSNTTPVAGDMAGYDVVMWITGREISGVLSATDLVAIQAYIDQGGAFYLESMDFLTTQTSVTTFIANYLGVNSFTRDVRAHTLTGASGDPIANGMILPVSFPQESMNKADALITRPTSAGVFQNELGDWNIMRNIAPGGERVIFSTVPFAALSHTDGYPNNTNVLTQRILAWFVPPDPLDVPAQLPTSETRILAARPNPFSAESMLSFRISTRAASNPVHLMLVDPSGREVRSLIHGRLEAGDHAVSWDGLDQGGHAVSSGVYFVRLESADGMQASKLILTR